MTPGAYALCPSYQMLIRGARDASTTLEASFPVNPHRTLPDSRRGLLDGSFGKYGWRRSGVSEMKLSTFGQIVGNHSLRLTL